MEQLQNEVRRLNEKLRTAEAELADRKIQVELVKVLSQGAPKGEVGELDLLRRSSVAFEGVSLLYGGTKRNSFFVGFKLGEDSKILPEIFNPSKN